MLNPACYSNLIFSQNYSLHGKRLLVYLTVQQFQFLCEPKEQPDVEAPVNAEPPDTGMQLANTRWPAYGYWPWRYISKPARTLPASPQHPSWFLCSAFYLPTQTNLCLPWDVDTGFGARAPPQVTSTWMYLLPFHQHLSHKCGFHCGRQLNLCSAAGLRSQHYLIPSLDR